MSRTTELRAGLHCCAAQRPSGAIQCFAARTHIANSWELGRAAAVRIQSAWRALGAWRLRRRAAALHLWGAARSDAASQQLKQRQLELDDQRRALVNRLFQVTIDSGDAQLRKHLLGRGADVHIAPPGLARSLHVASPDGHGERRHKDDGALLLAASQLDTWRS